MKFLRAGSITLIVLGAIHLTAHIVGTMNPSLESLQVRQTMADYKIDLFGTHDLLKFHKGFSIMMGFLFIAFGTQNLFNVSRMTKNGIVSLALISLAACILSVVYFHLLATSFLAFSTGCYLMALRKKA